MKANIKYKNHRFESVELQQVMAKIVCFDVPNDTDKSVLQELINEGQSVSQMVNSVVLVLDREDCEIELI